MKITKDRLKQLIEQEVKTLLEDEYDYARDQRRMGSGRGAYYGGRYKTQEDALQAGYEDGVEGREPAAPKEPLYMDGYEHGKEEREQERAGIQEGFENITAENLALAMQALKQVAINFSPALAGAIAAGAYAQLKDKVSKPDAEDE
tara:strand:+ start:277 stop:714 length:438 start_codon:yes stop_codon:yes gene_type:complete